jgi:hypothetical protein
VSSALDKVALGQDFFQVTRFSTFSIFALYSSSSQYYPYQDKGAKAANAFSEIMEQWTVVLTLVYLSGFRELNARFVLPLIVAKFLQIKDICSFVQNKTSVRRVLVAYIFIFITKLCICRRHIAAAP